MKRFTQTISDHTASTVSSNLTMTTDDNPLYENPDDIQYNKSSNPRPYVARRGGVLFEDNSQYKLQRVKYASAKKGILKVASLEDSLRSTLPLRDGATKPRRSSLTLESLTTSLRNLFAGAGESPRGCNSLPTGMDLALHLPDRLDDSTASTRDASPQSVSAAKAVQFSDIDMRMYPMAPDDNPAVSKGPAIALSGWHYQTLSSVAVDDYESTRGNRRRAVEDLKLDMMERRQRLMEHGASPKEIAEFARRAHRAKRSRLETLEAAKIYGKHHEARLERREEQRTRVRGFLSRAFGIRRTESQQQSALWDQAQQQ